MSEDNVVVNEALPGDPERKKFSKLLLQFMPIELREALNSEAENLDMPTSRYAVAVLEGLSPDQRSTALIESRKKRVGGGKIFRDQERARASS